MRLKNAERPYRETFPDYHNSKEETHRHFTNNFEVSQPILKKKSVLRAEREQAFYVRCKS